MQASVTLTQYQCIKKVHAAKITGIEKVVEADAIKLYLGEIGGVVTKSREWANKHTPVIGGYYVKYDDGYASFSPAKAFESGYLEIK